VASFGASRLRDYEHVVCCRRDGGELVGAVGLYLSVNQLCVDARCWGRGVGSALLWFVCAEFAGADLALYVDRGRQDTASLVRFYEKRGFEQVESAEGLAVDSESEVLMVFTNAR
jgi:ribosomal protein S18 acetylase RimI-like enzyme